MPSNIVVIGGIVRDLVTTTHRVPDSGETLTSKSFSTHPGGKGANSAVAAYRLSHRKPATVVLPVNNDINGFSEPVTAISEGANNDTKVNGWNDSIRSSADNDIHVFMKGAVGEDSFGPGLLDILSRNGVDISGMRTVPHEPTGVCVIIVEEDLGENRILFSPGANRNLLPNEFTTLEGICAGGVKPDLLISQLELRRETVEQIIQTAAREGVETLLNPAPAHALLLPVYGLITHLVMNETEAATLSGLPVSELTVMEEWGNVTDEFLRRGVKNVVVTLGAKGAYYSNEIGKGASVDAEKGVKVVDTTGAG